MPEGRRAFIARFFGEAKAAEFDVPPGPLAWLVEMWQDAGSVRLVAGPMGLHLTGLGWPEIVAWIEGAGEHDLAPLYRRAIMQLSQAYAATAMAARDVEAEAPWDPGKG